MQDDPVASISKGFWDSLWEHVLFFLGWPIMSLISVIQKRKAIKDGTWPAKISSEFIRDSVYLPNIRCARVVLKISIIPRIPFHLDRLAIIKENSISPLDAVVYSGLKGGLIPEVTEEKDLHLGEASGVIKNKDIDRVYYCDATFFVPSEETEDLRLKVVALVDIKGKSYKSFSGWISEVE